MPKLVLIKSCLLLFLSVHSAYADWRSNGHESQLFRSNSPYGACAASVGSYPEKTWGSWPESCVRTDSMKSLEVISGANPQVKCIVERKTVCEYEETAHWEAHTNETIVEQALGSATYSEAFVVTESENKATCNGEANPCDAVTGRKKETITDFRSQFITFARSYDSGTIDSSSRMGKNWKHSFETTLDFKRVPIKNSSSPFPPEVNLNNSSSQYWQESEACESGWNEIKHSYRGGLLSAYSSIWEEDVCIIRNAQGQRLAVINVFEASASGMAVFGNSGSSKIVSRPNGAVHWFSPDISGGYSETNNGSVTLKEENNGFVFTSENGTQDYFFAGLLSHRTLPSGDVLTIQRDADGRIASIIDPYGDEVTLEYNDQNMLDRLIHSEGVIQYTYDEIFNLSTVTYEDQSVITYHYEDLSYPNQLTGYTDQKGVRFATWSYDEKGRAISSEHAGGVEKVQFEYQSEQTIVTDALGAQRIYHLGSEGGQYVVTNVTGDRCQTCNLSDAKIREYDENGRLNKKIDWENNVTTYEYDERGFEVIRTEGVGTAAARIITTEWHESLPLPISIRMPGRETSYTYDVEGRILATVITDTSDPNLPVLQTNYSYENGRLTLVDGPRTDVIDTTAITYDEKGNITSVTNAAGHVQYFDGHNNRGLPTLVTDENGVERSLTYNVRGLLEQVTVKALPGDPLPDTTTSLSYDSVGQLISVVNSNGIETHYEYDDARRLRAIENALGERIEYDYDLMSNKVGITIKNSAQGAVFSEIFVYDKLSQLIQTISPLGYQSEHQYDGNGRQTNYIDGLGRSWMRSYDALNRLVKMVDPSLNEINYSYDALDRLTSVTDQRGIETSYRYNAFGQIVEQNSPDTGLTEKRYDSAGNMVYKKDARGVESHYQYDVLNRLVSVDYPANPEENITYSYDIEGECSFGLGRLSAISDLGGFIEYRYDSRGNLAQKRYQIEPQTYAISYDYDAANRLEVITYPSGRLVRFSRNEAGQISRIETRASISGAWQPLATDVSHQPFGGIQSYISGNGLEQSMEYDESYRLVSQHVPGVLERNYSYDANLNITGITDGSNSQANQSFVYDELNRLSLASGIYGQQQFEYDAVGNRTLWQSTQSSADQTHIYTYKPSNNQLSHIEKILDQQSSFRTLQHSANGQLSKDVRFDGVEIDLHFNDANRLYGIDKQSTPTTTYLHNGLGQRISKVSTDPAQDEHYHYNEQGQLIAVANSTSGEMVHYVYLNNQLIAMIKDDVENYDSETCWGDADADGLDDHWEMHFFGDLSRDGTGDSDGDNFLDIEEFTQGSNPTEITADLDSLPDSWELQYFGSLGHSESGDFDGDGYSNWQEYIDGSDPSDATSAASETADEDADGMLDRWEFKYFATLNRDGMEDFDGDEVSDIGEFLDQTDPTDSRSFDLSSVSILIGKPWISIIL